MQTQPRFSVVTFVLVALTALAVLSKVLQPYVVGPTNPRLANSDATFLEAGAHEHVAWYPVSDVAFKQARTLDRPILLVVGAPWSQTARRMDASVFSSVTVQKMLARNFMCIRVDAVETPDWMSAYLPLSRAALMLPTDFQMWLLDSQARLFSPVGARAGDSGYTETQFLNELSTDLSHMQDARAAEAAGEYVSSDAGQLQGADLDRLAVAPQSLVPALGAYLGDLVQRTRATPAGGFPMQGRQLLWPDAWRFMLACGDPRDVSTSIQPLLESPVRDMLDGGFFYGSRDAAWRLPLYDKAAVPDAEMCQLLAELSVRNPGDTPYAQFATETFDSLVGEFESSDGFVRPCRIGDERANLRRSQHASFNPRQLRSLLDGVERGYAQDVLHLQPGPNPSMTPYVTDFAQIGTPMYVRVVPKLRHFGPTPAFDPEVTLATAGAAAARLLQAARLLDDASRLEKAHQMAERLDLFRRGDDVVHELSGSQRAQPTLTDYLAFADASLQDYLSSSRVAALEDGAAVLVRGLRRFAIPGQAGYRMASANSPHRVAPGSDPPEICDDSGESANAAAIRLAWSYARLLRASGSKADRMVAQDLFARAGAALTQFADVAVEMGPYTGGYALASALNADDTIILCSGRDPVGMANQLARQYPFRLVAPVSGPVFPQLVSKPGYYVVRRGQTYGPLTVKGVAGMVRQTLDMGG